MTEAFRRLGMDRTMPWLGRYPWRPVRYEKGAYLCRYGEPVPPLLLLLEGRVSVSLTPAHGRTHIVTYCEPGQLICGDVEVVFQNALATADLKAESRVLCAGISIQEHRPALLRDPEFLCFALRRVSLEMIKDSVYAANNLLFPLEDRLAAYLVEQARDGLFQGNLTRTAELLGVSYRQLSRVLRAFQDQGKLERTKGGFRILDRGALEEQARDIMPLPRAEE